MRMILEQLELLSLSSSIGLLLFITVLAVIIKSIMLLIDNKCINYTAAQIPTDQRLDMLQAILSQRCQYYLRNPSGSISTAWRPRAQRSSTAFAFGATLITRVFLVVIHAPSRRWRAGQQRPPR